MNQHPYNTFSDHIRVGMRVTRILMGTAALIDSVQFFLSDGLTELALPIAGNRNFNK